MSQYTKIQGNNNNVTQVINNVFAGNISMDFFQLEYILGEMIDFMKDYNNISPSTEKIKFFDTKRVNIELKNKINKLPDDFFSSIKDYIPDFEQWHQALFSPENEECAKKYRILVNTLNPIMKIAPSFADAIASLITNLNNYLTSNGKKVRPEYRERMVLMIYFMYYFCDIGRDPHANPSTI